MSPESEPRRRKPDGTRACSMADALELIGDRWSLLVIREIGFGVRRFTEIQRNTGAPREMLTARLRKLEAVGVVRRERYQDRPPRSDYVLTDAGTALLPVLRGLREWGERFATESAQPGRPMAGSLPKSGVTAADRRQSGRLADT